MDVVVKCDGSGNTGGKPCTAAASLFVRTSKCGLESNLGLVKTSVEIAYGKTSNYMEYQAVILGIKMARDYISGLSGNLNSIMLYILTDSQIVAYQIKGIYQCHTEHLKVMCSDTIAELSKLPILGRVSVLWVPREVVGISDFLGRLTVDKVVKFK